jgi:hypothetical protein
MPVSIRAPLAFAALVMFSAPLATLDGARGATGAPAAGAHPKTSAVPPASAWRTASEESGYRSTPDYEATLAYCRRLEQASPWVRLTSYGTSGQGRALPLLIVSRDRAFTPEAARASGKAIVLIQNGIHSGEIEGKDASLELVRDLAVLRTRERLLDHAILLVLPILSVDAHERRSRFNRINQNGPEEMGWRTTPIGLNLNRDYLKAEAPEIEALLARVFTKWWPHLLIDDHTTDGVDMRHDVTYGFNHGVAVPRAVDRWLTEAFEGRAVPRLAAMGHLPAPYVDFRGQGPVSGIDFGNAPGGLSHGYAPLQCRPAILCETHMIKPYGTRVRATYDLLVAVLEEIAAHPQALLDAVSGAEAEVVARGRERDPARREYALSTRTTDRSVPFAFKGYALRYEPSAITGSPIARYTTTPWDTIIPVFRDVVPELTIRQPVGYLVPREWTIVRGKLEMHGIRFRAFVKPWSDTVEVERIVEWREGALGNGHHPTMVQRDTIERRRRSFRPGDLWVPLDQRSAQVAVQLLEARAPGGLVHWNVFDTALEQKEYTEDYVMEPVAKRMLDADPALAREFEARLATDSVFARSPRERINFFYRRSPWADAELNLLPVSRALAAPPESVLAR